MKVQTKYADGVAYLLILHLTVIGSDAYARPTQQHVQTRYLLSLCLLVFNCY